MKIKNNILKFVLLILLCRETSGSDTGSLNTTTETIVEDEAHLNEQENNPLVDPLSLDLKKLFSKIRKLNQERKEIYLYSRAYKEKINNNLAATIGTLKKTLEILNTAKLNDSPKYKKIQDELKEKKEILEAQQWWVFKKRKLLHNSDRLISSLERIEAIRKPLLDVVKQQHSNRDDRIDEAKEALILTKTILAIITQTIKNLENAGAEDTEEYSKYELKAHRCKEDREYLEGIIKR